MKQIEQLVKKFLKEEEFTLRNALAYAGLGLGKTQGALDDIVLDIAFNGNPYNDERKKRVAEHLGEMMFYWQVLASTCDISPEDIEQQFVSEFLTKNKKVISEMTTEEVRASILELMEHVKPKQKVKHMEIETKRDEKLKKKMREEMLRQQLELTEKLRHKNEI